MALKALDGLSLRADATAQNIANAGTAGYRPLRVSFEDALSSAAGRGVEAVRQILPHADAMPRGTSVRLDLEMQAASATALRYGAVIDVLGRTMRLDALAVEGGR